MKTKTLIICTIVVLAALTIWLLYNQNKPAPEPGPEPPLQEGALSGNEDGLLVALPPPIRELPTNEDGLIEVIIPQNLFGGKDKTAGEYIDEWLADNNDDDFFISLFPTDEGNVTFVFSLDQLEEFRQRAYTYSLYQNFEGNESIIEVVYENEMLTEITVLVDPALYVVNVFERQMCNSLLAVSAGLYQILSGVPPDEWHTTITVKDGETDEIISKNEFPNDDMYRMY